MVDNCISGYNSSIFAYGQTGSGKTHTMLGQIDKSRPSTEVWQPCSDLSTFCQPDQQCLIT